MNDVVLLEPIRNSAHEEKKMEKNFVEHISKESLMEKLPSGNKSKILQKKIEVWAQDIKGIIYHLDKNGNIYDPQHVHQNLKNPAIIAKYIKDENGDYEIPNIF